MFARSPAGTNGKIHVGDSLLAINKRTIMEIYNANSIINTVNEFGASVKLRLKRSPGKT